jgi:hypothetical protein
VENYLKFDGKKQNDIIKKINEGCDKIEEN